MTKTSNKLDKTSVKKRTPLYGTMWAVDDIQSPNTVNKSFLRKVKGSIRIGLAKIKTVITGE